MVEANNIPGATYGREIDENGEVRSWVGIPERLAGNYQVRAIPWSVAAPDDTYSATVEFGRWHNYNACQRSTDKLHA